MEAQETRVGAAQAVVLVYCVHNCTDIDTGEAEQSWSPVASSVVARELLCCWWLGLSAAVS